MESDVRRDCSTFSLSRTIEGVGRESEYDTFTYIFNPQARCQYRGTRRGLLYEKLEIHQATDVFVDHRPLTKMALQERKMLIHVELARVLDENKRCLAVPAQS
jgi:hypothetical protein